MTWVRSPWLFLILLTAGCASHGAVSPVTEPGAEPGATLGAKPGTAPELSSDFGILLMAHGGSPDWNEGVLAAVKPLRNQYAIEVAFGMADAVTIQEAVQSLEARGISRIGVVRLFVSGESWYDRTEQILGLSQGAPVRPVPASHTIKPDDGGSSREFWRVETESSFSLTTQGLSDAQEMGTVLADRARTLSHDPQREDVLILAHGPGDDAENQRWITSIDARADEMRSRLPFRRVRVMTLREDGREKREEAEHEIRAFVQRARDDGGTAIVIPFRVQGFGPYAQVLDGLDYVSDGQALIPHPGVTQWIAGQINMLRRGVFLSRVDG